jgi:hypothetical protein
VRIVPPDELRPRNDTVAHNVGAAIDDPYSASVQIGFFMGVRDEHRIPKTERFPKSNRPRPRRIDLDADPPKTRPSQISVFGARFIGAGPVGLRLFGSASRNTAQGSLAKLPGRPKQIVSYSAT